MAEKKFSERLFKVQPMRALDAVRLQAKLMKLVGPALGHLGDILKGAGENGDKSGSDTAAIAAFTDIFSRAEPDEVANLIKEVVEIAMIRRDSGSYHHVDFDADMSDYPQDIYPLVIWVLREQFTPFFNGLLANGRQRGATSN